MPYELTAEATQRVREAFESVLEAAAPAYELGQLQLFHEEDEAFIQKEVERKLYEPRLPSGGALERKIVKRLEKMALAHRDWHGAGRVHGAILRWKKVLPDSPRNPGRYYVRHPLSSKQNKNEWEWVTKLREEADMRKEWDMKWLAELLLDGHPEPVSNFTIECLFLLRGPDGNVTRLVRLKNILGETSRGVGMAGSEILDAEALAAPEKFRRWCLSRGSFNWEGNQKELQALHEDLWRESAWRVITRVDSCGWYPLGKVKGKNRLRGIWFYDDCAFGEAAHGGPSALLRPDEDGIIWFEGEGYYLGEKGREASFVHGRPRMRPDWKATELAWEDWREAPPTKSEDAILSALLREMCHRLYETLGGYEGWMSVGAFLAFAAGPEVFEHFRFASGLWVHGEKGSGKTSLVRWLMRLWGFVNIPSGVALAQKTSTAVGILQQSENYSYLPLWLDEFRQHQIGEDKAGILRTFYDRSGQAKWSPDGIARTIKTGAVVSGESTSGDAATRSRFPHVQASKHKWMAEHGPWLERHAEEFALIGRYVMERRGEFVENFESHFRNWLAFQELAKVDDRERKVHGVAYAGLAALMQMLQAFQPQEWAPFKKHMLTHSKSAAEDVEGETNVNVFWSDMVTAFEAGAIPVDCFLVEGHLADHPPGADNVDENGRYTQGRWDEIELYIYPDLMMAKLQEWLTKQRGSVVLNRKDLRDQSSKNEWWLSGKLRKRFGDKKHVTACWGIKLDKHPLGYQGPITDEEHNQMLLNAEAGDPRKGPLYAIVERWRDARLAKD